MEEITIFPTSEYEKLKDILFALVIHTDNFTAEPRLVFDPHYLDLEEAEEIARDMLKILSDRDILIPRDQTSH